MTKRKSHQQWAWIIIVSFFILGIVNIRFGILGLLCMGAPIYHALRGRGKVHCSKYCPRGSFLGKFIALISMGHTLPKFMRTKKFRNIILLLMLSLFTFSMSHTGFVFAKMAFVMFRFMGMSFIIGIIIGIFFKPRSWCQICPMGHGASLVDKAYKRVQKSKLKKVYE